MEIDRGSDRAVFRQLADLLRDRIRAGQLPPGARLPSELDLVRQYGLSRTSVRQAIGLLRGEGLVEVDPPWSTRVKQRSRRTSVRLDVGAVVTARMPTPAERRRLDCPEGVPVLQVDHDGHVEVYDADRTVLHVRSPLG